jgi:hypothetical protein
MNGRARVVAMAVLAAGAACGGCSNGERVTAQSGPPPLPPPTPAPAAAATTASSGDGDAYAAHVAALRARLETVGLDGFAIRVEEPFVVAGDDERAALERKARTVRWAVERLERDFFATRPARVLDVYLFRDAASYRRGVEALTGAAPGTPYGFYSSEHGGLFMNIATGGGTLVHEIVHPYVEADFPSAPPWLNEGLGSLFEQSSDRGGHIVGETNWRLAGLQAAIRKGPLPSFRVLAAMSERAFYDDDRGTNYAQARYLLYYLQEQGRLVDFYRAFRGAASSDPTGYDTLVATLGERDLTAFQRRWERWVLTLVFDG